MLEDLKIITNHSNLTDLYRTIYPRTAELIFPHAHRALTRRTLFQDIKQVSLYCKFEMLQNMLSKHNKVKLEISNDQIFRKTSNIWRLNKLLNNESKKKS